MSLPATRQWAIEHLAQPPSVRDLAHHARLSERTFAQRFVTETGTTSLRWLVGQRLLVVDELLDPVA